MIYVEHPFATACCQIKDRLGSLLGRTHSHDSSCCILDYLQKEFLVDSLSPESSHIDVKLTEVEGHNELQKLLVLEGVLPLKDQTGDLFSLLFVGLQDLRYKPLHFLMFEFHFAVVIDLHHRYFELSVDQLGESFSRSIIDHKGVIFGLRRGNIVLDAALGPEILLEKDEVILIADEAISVQVDLVEEQFINIFWPVDSNSVERILHSLDKLQQVHNSFIPMSISLLPMQSLYGQLSEVLLNAEIDLL